MQFYRDELANGRSVASIRSELHLGLFGEQGLADLRSLLKDSGYDVP